MKIKDVISIDKGFLPVFDVKDDTKDYWRRFIANDKFINILEHCIDSINSSDGKTRKSFWIQGTYGTGKSHSAAVVKHLLWDDINNQEENKSYIEREISRPEVLAKLKNFRKTKKLLPVIIKGAEAASDLRTMVYTIQKAVDSVLKEHGFNIISKTIFDDFISLVEDKSINFEHIINADDELSVFVENENDILEKLKAKDIDFAGKLTKALSNKLVNISTSNIEEWLSGIECELKKQNLADGIIIFWDEFTSILDKHDPAIINQVQGIAELSKAKDIFLYLISHRMPSAIDASAGSEDIKKIEDRFYILRYDMEPTTTYHILAKSIKIEKEKEFNEIKNLSYSEELLGLARSLSQNRGSAVLDDIKSLFPMHPYSIYILTFIARNIGSTNRSIFNFLNDDKIGFVAFLENDFAKSNMLTIDYLWDFFIEIFKDNSNFSLIVNKYNNYKEKVEQNSNVALSVFKSILMLNALNSILSTITGEENFLEPKEENIYASFLSTNFSNQDISNALLFLTETRVVEKNPFNSYVIEISSLQSKDIEREKLNLSSRFENNPFDVLNWNDNPHKDALENVIYEETLRVVDIIYLKKESQKLIESKLKNEFKFKYSLDIAIMFALKKQDAFHARDLLSNIARDNNELKNKIIIFIEEVFGDECYDKFLDYLAKYNLSADQGLDQAGAYKANILELIKDWTQRIKDANVKIYFNDLGEKEVKFKRLAFELNNRYAPIIFSKGLDKLNTLRNNATPWKIKNSKSVIEKVLAASNKNMLTDSLVGANSAVSSVFKDTDDSYILTTEMALKKDGIEDHPIFLLKKAVSDRLTSLQEESSFNLMEALLPLFREPYGYYSSMHASAALSFVMREYVNKLFDMTSIPIDAVKMKDLLARMFSDLTKCNTSSKNDYIVRFGSQEEQELKDLFSELFSLNGTSNLTDTKWKINDYCKKIAKAPLWSLLYLPSTTDALKPAIDDINKFVSSSYDIDLKKIKDLLASINNVKVDLQLQINGDSFSRGFDNYIQGVLIDRKISIEKLLEVKNSIRATMQSEPALWTEEKVNSSILSYLLQENQKKEKIERNPEGEETPPVKVISVEERISIKDLIESSTYSENELKRILINLIDECPEVAKCLKAHFKV